MLCTYGILLPTSQAFSAPCHISPSLFLLLWDTNLPVSLCDWLLRKDWRVERILPKKDSAPLAARSVSCTGSGAGGGGAAVPTSATVLFLSSASRFASDRLLAGAPPGTPPGTPGGPVAIVEAGVSKTSRAGGPYSVVIWNSPYIRRIRDLLSSMNRSILSLRTEKP